MDTLQVEQVQQLARQEHELSSSLADMRCEMALLADCFGVTFRAGANTDVCPDR